MSVLTFVLLAGCGDFGLATLGGSDSGRPDLSDADTDTDTDADADADTDADADADADSDADADTDADTDTFMLEIDAVNPEYGTTAGGAVVTISGGPFDESARVRFGGQAATVQSATRDELVVRTPAFGGEGSVDVLVTTDDGEGSLVSGFTYWQDGAGKGGLVGLLGWYDYIGTYWDASATDEGSGWFAVTPPQDLELWELYAGAMDSCEPDTYVYAGSAELWDVGVDNWNLNLPTSGAIPFGWDATYGQYTVTTFNNTKYVANGSYDLPAVTPTTGFPPFEFPDAVTAPPSFSISSPALNSSTPPRINRNAFNLAWSGSGGDFMLAQILLWNSTTVTETVYCVMRDDGSFTVPSATFSRWSAGNQITISVGRGRYGTGLNSFNNSESRFAGVYWLIGAGTMQ